MDFDLQRVAHGLVYYVVLLFSLSFHESAHAWAALKMGDDTAARLGRISLNPLVHIDPIGTFLIPIVQILTGWGFLIGWAKPTPYNPANFDRKHSLAKGHVRVAAAGPLSNLLLAAIFFAALFGLTRVVEPVPALAGQILGVGVLMNVVLALFNLVPLPPLDGSKVALFGLPRSLGEAYDRYVTPYGAWILLLLFATGVLGAVLSPFTNLVQILLYTILR